MQCVYLPVPEWKGSFFAFCWKAGTGGDQFSTDMKIWHFSPKQDAILSHLCYAWISHPAPQWAQFRRKRVPVHWTGQANTFHSATTHDRVGCVHIRYQISSTFGIWSRTSDARYRVSDISDISDTRYRVPDIRISDASYRVSGTELAKSIYLRLREQNSPLSTLWQRELEVRTGESGEALYCKEEKARSGKMVFYLNVLFVLLLDYNCNRVCEDATLGDLRPEYAASRPSHSRPSCKWRNGQCCFEF